MLVPIVGNVLSVYEILVLLGFRPLITFLLIFRGFNCSFKVVVFFIVLIFFKNQYFKKHFKKKSTETMFLSIESR